MQCDTLILQDDATRYQYISIHYDAMQYKRCNTIRYATLPHNTIQWIQTVQYTTKLYNIMRYSMQYMIQHMRIQYDQIQYDTTQYKAT